MRKVKQIHGWGIYALSSKEESEYGFSFAVIHPDTMGCAGLTPADTDWECDSIEEAIGWVVNYEN